MLPVVGCSLVGVGAAEHLVPSCLVHYDVLPFGDWDLAEEEEDLSSCSLFVVDLLVAAAAVCR
jgi:hypothetical protein